MVSAVIFRTHQHTGSLWLSELLAERSFAPFFEFKSGCRKSKNVTLRNWSWDNIYRQGCNCLSPLCPTGQPHCLKGQLCQNGCPALPRPKKCLGVVVINSLQPDMLRFAARVGPDHARPRTVIFERTNFVKLAISYLKMRCSGFAPRNHARIPLPVPDDALPSKVLGPGRPLRQICGRAYGLTVHVSLRWFKTGAPTRCCTLHPCSSARWCGCCSRNGEPSAPRSGGDSSTLRPPAHSNSLWPCRRPA